MEVYVKESLHVLDYKDKIVDTIFTSDDKQTPGYAYNITITEENTGYSNLTFQMPNTIIDKNAEQIKNPKLALLTPLVKLRYHREVYYMGDEPITVREPQGYGDKITYVDKTYSNKYPDNLIEDYIMDYIVQPIDKKRDVLKLDTSFTAMDYPRFNLSKKKVGLSIDANATITKKEWSLYKNAPLDNPGTIKYKQWTTDMSQRFQVGDNKIPTEWNPLVATDYPLTKDNIIKLMGDTSQWPYGLLATAFYWPITETGRFNGVLYKEGGYLVLQLYDFYNLTTKGINPDLYIDRYAWEWTQLYEVQPYLCPNNAKNYLHYILEGTNWSVAKKEDGTDDVDIVVKNIPNPPGSTTDTTDVDSTCNISVSNSNCYNAITEVCKGLQLYPIFDCVNRTVALKVFAGKNYGLNYSLGSNLGNNSTKSDGEKIITKLYVTGGKDYNGDASINIGTAERSYVKTLTGFYKQKTDAPTADVEGYWIIVDPSFTDSDFKVIKYKQDMTPYTATVHNELVNKYWEAGPDRQVYFWNNQTNQWVLGHKETSGYWSGIVNGNEYIVDPITGTQTPWDPNDDVYVMSRSPYGTNYIINLRWAYQNKWITKEEILELYQYNLLINDLDYMFMDKYTEDRRNTQQAYNTAVNNYDIAQDEFESTLHAMESKYYIDNKDVSKGTVYCFHTAPVGTYNKFNPALGKTTKYIKIFHCYNPKCSSPTFGIKPNGSNAGANIITCPHCGSTDVTNDEIYIPTYDDYPSLDGNNVEYPFGTDISRTYEGYRYNSHLKGYYLRLVMSLDKDNEQWDIKEYEKRVSLLEDIEHREGTATIDGYDYILSGVYVRSTSGQIETWNESVAKYISAYGRMLNYLREVNGCLERIEELQDLYDAWAAKRDEYHAIIQDKFGDYLVEGNYINDEQPSVGLLFDEGMEASDKYSVPEITYNLNVIDAGGLAEYRIPRVTKYSCVMCGNISYTPITVCPKCDSQKIITINDVYNDLVHMLHNVGQIVPKAGDYVTVYDEPMGMFGVPALITEIKRQLDDPCKNSIKLDTSYTDDEELVGNIITATNIVLNNADIYARTAILKADGTIDSTSIKETLDNSNADITIVGTNGNILLNGSGLRASDPNDPHRAMKYAGNGIFSTTNLDNEEGETVIWEKMMTPSGINATYLRSGTIDTNKLTIMSGLSGKVMIDQNGLAVKRNAAKTHHVTEFDANAAKNDASYASNWGAINNIASFIGVTNGNNPLIYTKGFLVAEEGSNIANWITSSEGFYHLNGTTKDLWLSPNGINGVVNNSGSQKFSYYVNGNFGVTTDGKLYAKGAVIDGDSKFTGYIHITDNTSDMNTGTMAGWTVGEGGLSKDDVYISSKGINGTIDVGNGYSSNGPWSLYSHGNFGVTTGGTLYAKNAYVGGAIYASTGNIGGCVINGSGQLQVDNSHITDLNADKINAGYLSADRIKAGSITANKLKVTELAAVSANTGTLKVTGELTAARLKISNEGWLAYYNDDNLTKRVMRITQHGNMYFGSTDGDDIKDGGSNAVLGIYNNKETTVNGDTRKTPIIIGGDDKITMAVYGDPGWGSFNGWHFGLTTNITVCRDIDVAFGQYITLEICKGLIVGLAEGRPS